MKIWAFDGRHHVEKVKRSPLTNDLHITQEISKTKMKGEFRIGFVRVKSVFRASQDFLKSFHSV